MTIHNMSNQRCRNQFMGLCILALAPIWVAAAETATAPNSNQRYASVTLWHDDQDGQQVLGVLSLTLGDNAWIMAGGGQSHSEQGATAHSPTLLTGGIGAAGNSLQFTLDVTNRHASNYQQRDWNGVLDWHNDRLMLGVMAAIRNADSDSTAATSTPGGGTAFVPVSQTVKGGGLGVHVRVNATSRLSLFAAGMKYDYTVTTRQNGTVTTTDGSNGSGVFDNLINNQPLLSQTTLSRTSLVTRDEAALARSLDAGVVYQFNRVALSSEYFNDQVQGVQGSVDTVQVKAAFNLSSHWRMTPGIGNSHSNQYGSVNFGVLTLAYTW